MAIQKGSKNEIAVNWKKENSNDLMGKISRLLENPNLNSIVSIHNYISDSNLPVKIYDNKKAFNPLNSDNELDFETFLNLNKDKFFKNIINNNINNGDISDKGDKPYSEEISLPANFIDKYPKNPYYLYSDKDNKKENEEIRINYDQIFKDYLNYTRNKLKENSKFFSYSGLFGKFLYKFWELYYFDDYFILYMSVFTILVFIIVLLIVIIMRIREKNNKLKDKLKSRKKSTDSIEDDMNKNINDSYKIEKFKTSNIQNPNNPNDTVNNHQKKEVTCIETDFGAICLYTENKNIQNLRELISENKINDQKLSSSTINEKNPKIIENEFLAENQRLLDMQSLQVHQEAKLNLINNKQFEELFKPQLDFNLKNSEIQNKVESTFCILKDADGKIVKIENKQLITKYHDNPEVTERIMQVTGQIGLINVPENKTISEKFDDIKSNKGSICEFNKLKLSEEAIAINYNKTINSTNRCAERRFSENIEITKNNSNNFEIKFPDKDLKKLDENTRAKSNNNKKPDFQPIQFSIKAVQEKEKTEFTFEKASLTSLGIYNASTDTNFNKFDDNSNLITKETNKKENNSNESVSESKAVKSFMIENKASENLIIDNNKLAVYENKLNTSKFQISVKNRSKSKQRINNNNKNGSLPNNILNENNQKEEVKYINNINNIKNENDNNIKNSPAADKAKIELRTNKEDNKNPNNNNKNQLSCIIKTNNLNLKCKYKEYKEFNLNDPNEKNKLFKIDTTFIDEGRIGKNFEEFSKVGEGGFGSVFKAKHKIDGSLYAIKVIKLDLGISQSLKDHKVIKEVKTMMKLYHKNVVRYYTCWFQLNIDEIKNLKSESDNEESIVTSSCVVTNTIKKNKYNNRYNNSSSNYSESFFGSVSNFKKTFVKKENENKQVFESDDISQVSKTKNYINNLNTYKNNKIIKKINFNNLRDKSLNDSKCYESPEKLKKSINTYDHNIENYSKSSYVSRSVSKNNNNNYINLYSTNTKNKKSFNPFIELNATKSAILNQISENGESDFNSKNLSEAGGFNWEDSNFISKKKNESLGKSRIEKSSRRGRSSENSKLNISYNGNSFWNESKQDYIEKSIKHVDFTDKNGNKNEDYHNKNQKVENNFEEKIRKFSSLTDEINPDNNMYEKKAFSISLEKNAEEILSDSNDDIPEDSYFSNEETKNNSKFSPYYKNNNNNHENRNKNEKKNHAQDDSVIDLTKRNKKKKKEFVYNVYFLVQMEFCDGLSLNQYLEINKNNGLNKRTIFSFFKQILSGVNQIHKSNIIHRDLK